ncbi:F-box family protein [Rhynchospora pubera]|uniref:F-box family protein n=1 Tax=Rhynchospora pubera TaxID=906938 RepID=A0AAV8G752_9POAL|nr:F-box family protein [Rhynchospora pubera]
MDGRQRQKRRADFELNSDFISTMPAEIIENILVRLPIKEAVRTSILSSKWKSLWASISDLVFTEKISESELIRSVDNVLRLHQGSILKFELHSYELTCEETINRWLLFLSKNGLKDLGLSFNIFKDCKVPSSLFSCNKLEQLEISGFSACTISAPQCFQGLNLLRNLTLGNCHLVGITMEKFISGCPLLESLTLFEFVEHGCLAIRARNLTHLDLLGITCTDLLLETPKLTHASIHFDHMPHGVLKFGSASDGSNRKLLRSIGALSNIEELDIGSKFFRYLASGPIPEKLPVTFYHLKKISIYLDGSGKGVDTALCIFRKAPNLNTLCLTVPRQSIWEEQRITSIFLERLEVVVILDFEETVSMLGFAKFILSAAPQLEKLVIDERDINNLDDGMGFRMKLASLPRLSSKAVIVFDRSFSY